MVEVVENQGTTLAIIIRASHTADGIEFFTPEGYSQQLAYMRRAKDHVIAPHTHVEVKREVTLTQEVLLIRTGRVRVDLYDPEQRYVESKILSSGDVVLLAGGGHGFKMLEETEIIEVKQGPYDGRNDKVRFDPIDDTDVVVHGI